MIWVAGGCSSPPAPPERTAPGAGLTDTGDFTRMGLGPNDQLRIRVLGHPELSTETEGTRITFEGTIDVPLIGSVLVAGLRPEEVGEKLEEELARYLWKPDVTLTVIEYRSRQFYVLGHVERPGAFPLDRQMNALQGLAVGGPYLAGANRAEVFLLRQGPLGVEVHPFDAESPSETAFVSLQPDDILLVQRSGSGIFQEEVLPRLTGITGVVNSAAYIGLVMSAFGH